jgi:hypothetical protein
MPGPGNILIKIGADATQAVRELGTTDKALGSTMSTSEKMGATVKKAALPAAAALGAIGVAAIGATKAAMEDAAAQDHLAGVLKRTTGATESQVAATEDWIEGISRATGVSDDELRPSLETLVTATGDVTKSQKLMKQALDISAASGKSVEEVSKAMALATTGQTAKLEKLVPGLSAASKESDNMTVIMGELATLTGGAMAQSTETAAGQMKIMENQTAELQESLGAALLPVVEALVPIMVKLADIAAENTGAIKVLVVIVAALASGILVANAAMKLYAAGSIAVKAATTAWTAAQWLLNAALNANPIGLVVVALAALAAGIYLAYTRSETFRNIVDRAMDVVRSSIIAVDRAFDALKASAFAAWNWIQEHWKLALFAFGPIGAAVYLISENFDRIRRMASAAFDAIVGGINRVLDAIRVLLDWLGKIRFPSPPKWFRKLSPFGATFAAVPGVGLQAAPAGAAGRAGAGAAPVTINVFGAVDPEGTARAIRRILTNHDRRQGRTL